MRWLEEHKPLPRVLTLLVFINLVPNNNGQVPLPPQQHNVHLSQPPLAPQGVPISTNSPSLNNQGQVQPLLPLDNGNIPVGVPLPNAGVPLSNAGVPLSNAGVSLSPGPAIVPLDRVTPTNNAPYIPVANSGGLNAVSDPHNDAGIQKLIRHPIILQRLQRETNADSAVKITKLITANKQVVSGQMTFLSLRVVETLCTIGTPDLTLCQEDTTEDPHICEIAIWERPWLNSTKIIDEKTKCEEVEKDSDFKVPKYNIHRPVPLSPQARPLQTLPQEVDAKQVAVEAFNYVDRGSDSDFEGRMVDFKITNIMHDLTQKVSHITVNVEYGFTLCIRHDIKRSLVRTCPPDTSRPNYICTVTVVDNPNELMRLHVAPGRSDDINCVLKFQGKRLDSNFDGEDLVVAVPPASCAGCPQPTPLNDPKLLDIAQFAVTEYDRTSDDDDLHMVVRLVKASTQVISGIKYILTLELAETTCNKAATGVDLDRSFCKQDVTEETKFCDVHIVEQSWIPARDLVHARCYDKDEYPQASSDDFIVPVVSPTSQSPVAPVKLDASGQAAVDYVVAQYNRREVDDFDDAYNMLVKVHEASLKTFVGGQERHFLIEMGETNCFPKRARAPLDLRNCTLNPFEEHEVCEARVQEQNLQGVISRRLTYLDCDDLDDYLFKKTAKSIQTFSRQNQPFIPRPQGRSANQQSSLNKVSTNDPNVMMASSFVVDQFNLQSDEDEVYILSHIMSAYSQTPGSYMLELELSETRCKKYQPIVDASRCPVDHSEEPEICQAEVTLHPGHGNGKTLGRLYCDERDDYYIHRIAAKVGVSLPSHAANSKSTITLTDAVHWPSIDVNSRKLVRLAEYVADEFDLRSDEDNVFVMSKIHNAKQQVDSGLNYYLTVEIAETVCPKYKQGINKTRCTIDIGEEHKMCEAIIQEQAWLNKRQILQLHCADLDDFYEGDDSREILYPNVHPSAHARPVFKSQFTVKPRSNNRRFQESKESDESNEYLNRKNPHSNRRINYSHESQESNEKYYRPVNPNQQRQPQGHTPAHHFFDSDEGFDSDESRHWFRGKRSLGGFTEQDSTSNVVKDLADFGLSKVDEASNDVFLRRVSRIISAQSQVVSGINWKLEVEVAWTTCQKSEQPDNMSLCPPDSSRPVYSCALTIWEQPWNNFRQVTEHNCQ